MFISAGLSSCADSLIGKYSSQDNLLAQTTLDLKKNNGFYLLMGNGKMQEYLEGEWKKGKNYVVLNYYKKPLVPDSIRTLEKIIGSDSIKILVLSSGQPLSFSVVKIKEKGKDNSGACDEKGVVKLKRTAGDTIEVSHEGFPLFLYKIKDKDDNYFEFDLGKRIKYASYLLFNAKAEPDTFYIKGNKLCQTRNNSSFNNLEFDNCFRKNK
jgi:hypothetical protein